MCSYVCLCANEQQAFSNSIKVFLCLSLGDLLFSAQPNGQLNSFVTLPRILCGENVQRQKQHEMHLIVWIFSAWMSNIETQATRSKGQMLNKLKPNRMLKIHSLWPQKYTHAHSSTSINHKVIRDFYHIVSILKYL